MLCSLGESLAGRPWWRCVILDLNLFFLVAKVKKEQRDFVTHTITVPWGIDLQIHQLGLAYCYLCETSLIILVQKENKGKKVGLTYTLFPYSSPTSLTNVCTKKLLINARKHRSCWFWLVSDHAGKHFSRSIQISFSCFMMNSADFVLKFQKTFFRLQDQSVSTEGRKSGQWVSLNQPVFSNEKVAKW